MQRGLGWTIPQVFLALAIANAVVAIYIFTLVPEFLMRFLSWVLGALLYRLDACTASRSNVPDEGAALLVCNHVSYMDALILAARSRGRCASSCTTRSSTCPVMSWIFKTAQGDPDRRRARRLRS